MAKEKVTLTLDAEQLEEFRRTVGARSLSAAVDNSAVAAYLARLRHLTLSKTGSPSSNESTDPFGPRPLDWAAKLVEQWHSSAGPTSDRRAG